MFNPSAAISRHAPRLAVIGLAVLLPLAPIAASAQTAAVAPPRTMVSIPLQDLPESSGLRERASRVWSNMMSFIGISGAGHFMRSHRSTQGNQSEVRDEFASMMDLAGYKLKEIESSIGLVPTFGLTFGHARELTEADREYLERYLDRHARNNGGAVAVMQRTVLRGILDTSEISGFAVDKVDIDLFPLPKVKFLLGPADAPLGVEAGRIMRAIDQLNTRLQSIVPRTGGFDLSPRVEVPSLRPASATSH